MEIINRFYQCKAIDHEQFDRNIRIHSYLQMELDIQLGSAILFLSPRQIHSFQAIFQVLLQPSVEVK